MTLEDELPFGFTKNEYDLMTSYLKQNKTLLEYGCGKSTLKLSNYVKQLHSIEHTNDWYTKIKNELKHNNINNVSLHLIEPNIKSNEYSYFWYDCEELNKELGIKLLYDYIHFQKNLKFDDIFIDGRARVFCAEFSYDLLSPTSYLFFHDFINRPYYHRCLNRYKIVDKIDTLAILQKQN